MKKNDTQKASFSLELCDVVKVYENITAVNNVSFKAKRGEIIALLGPNGAGKSTLMNMIAGYLALSSGKILVNGVDVEKDDLKTKKDIGFLPEGAPMYADMTVRLFLKYFIELKLNLTESEILSKKQIQIKYDEELARIMELAQIESVSQQKIETLSKGYTRRVGFAESLIGNPPILLLDEPTDGLDPNQKEHIRKLICEMGKDKTIILSTHLLEEAESVADRIILINKGKIAIEGSLKEILTATKTKNLEQAFKLLTQTEKKYE
ncbi:MAG: ATP-binding cassette domain-containing protein [Alphaproteobacteria bacterium]|nr:ATP-binding cassette domain-containing protein [Alphaproteobacteria bacterium]